MAEPAEDRRAYEIAIVGAAGRFPRSGDLAELWANLRQGTECISFFSREELLAAGVPPRLLSDPRYVRARGRLAESDRFDAAFFGFTVREAEITSPQHRLFLECCWHALEDAGRDPAGFRGAIGVFASGSSSAYLFELLGDPELVRSVGAFRLQIANEKEFLPGWVSYKLDLKGPSINVQTACSSSLVAVHLACQSLLSRECDLALAGGVSVRQLDACGYLHEAGGILSPDGHCRAFDAAAQGTLDGDGAGVVVLKRLPEAIADGDTIRAVIKGSAVNNDGAAKIGYTAPGLLGQTRVVAEALAVAGVDPATVSYVETHGTGTRLGDPIEIAALGDAYRASAMAPGSCAVGSVKTNLGHLDAAAGIAGLLKTMLALEHRELPPSLHFSTPNPEIPFAELPFYVNAELAPWAMTAGAGDAAGAAGAGGRGRRAGVSSFGIGGTNAHVVLEEAPRQEPGGPSRPWQLLVWSARTAPARDAAAAALAARLAAASPPCLADAAFTLQQGRRGFAFRAALVCRDAAGAVAAIREEAPRRVLAGEAPAAPRPVAFLLPGQGTQQAGTAAQLYAQEEVFRAAVERCCELLRSPLGRDLRELLFPPPAGRDEAERLLGETAWAQPAVFVLGYSLAQLWISWGVRPRALLGHSLGEYVAACLSGVMTLADALELVTFRARLMQRLPRGGMLAVALPAPELEPLLGRTLCLAAVNAPRRSVVSGPLAALEDLERRLAGVSCRRLRTSHAFHSHMIDPILPLFEERVRRIALQPPRIPFLSSVTGRWITTDEATDPGYWCRQMRDTVEFAAAAGELLREDGWALLEVGRGQTLGSLLQRHPDLRADHLVAHSLDGPGQAGAELASLLTALGRLWAGGVEVDWKSFSAGERRLRLSLPAYPFERQRYRAARPGPAGVSGLDPAPAAGSIEPGAAAAAGAGRSEEVSMSVAMASRKPTEARRERILQALAEMVHELTGADPAAADQQVSFLELGVDSLLLIQATQKLEDRFGLRISLVQLLEELTTLAAVADYLERELPAAAMADPAPAPALAETAAAGLPPAVAPVAPAALPTAALPTAALPAAALPAAALPAAAAARAPGSVEAASGVERLFAQQLQIMAQQIQVLQGGELGLPAAGPAANLPVVKLPVEAPPQAAGAAAIVSAGTAAVAPASVATMAASAATMAASVATPSPAGAASGVGPYQPLEVGPGAGLTRRQQSYLESFVGRYAKRTARSKEITQRHRGVLADGRGSVGFRRPLKELVYPIHGDRTQGARIWDADGNEYVDVCMGFGLHFFGHSPDFVVTAMESQLRHGLGLGPQSTLAGEVAGMIAGLTGMERVAFCNSGTEAVMGALRAARTYTRRSKIALFSGSYHGWSDGTLARGQMANGRRVSVPAAPGVSTRAVEDVLVVEYGTPESLEILAAQMGELAAVLVEPVQSRRPDFAPREFLHELRRLTAAAGTVLIFDEMVTGFRLHAGGAQAWFGVQADLATYGKLIAAGLPIGVVAGRAGFMDVLDGGPWAFGDDSYPRAEKTMFAGAFFKHPLTLAAARAVLGRLQSEGPALQERLNARTARLCAELNDGFAAAGAPIEAVHCGSLFRFRFPRQLAYADLFAYHLIDHGIFYSLESGNCFLTPAHDERDLARLVEAVRRSVQELQEGDFLPSPAGPGGAGRPRRESAEAPRAPAVVLAPVSASAAAPAAAAAASSSAVPAALAPAAAPAAALPPRSGVDLSLYYFGSYDAAYDPAKYRLLLEGAKLADDLGFSAVWLPERHFHSFGGLSPNPAVLAAALACTTRRIELRAGSVVLPLHHPIRVAEEWSLVDNLSQGRAGVSFASGWHPNDFAFAPEAYANRHEVMRCGIETVRRLWRGETLEVKSGTGQPLGVRLFPLPTRADLPIWLTGTSAETYRFAGSLGAGVVTNLQVQSIDDIAERVGLYHEALALAGHDRSRARVTVLLHTYIAEDAAVARERARRPFCSYLRSNLGLLSGLLAGEGRKVDLERLDPESLDYLLNSHYERWVEGSTLIGSVESVAGTVERLARAGVTEVGCLIDFGVDADLVLDSLRPLDELRQRFALARPAGERSPEVTVMSVPSAPPALSVPSAPSVPSERLPLTEAQRALWFLTQMGRDASRAYNESITLRLRGQLRKDALAGALQEVAARHEALRIRIDADGEHQWVAPAEPFALPLVDLAALPDPRRQAETELRTLAWAQEPLDIERGPLLRPVLLRLAAADHRLILTTHHLAVDGHSVSVLLGDLAALYTAACEGRPAALPPPARFSDFARRGGMGEAAPVAADEAYWAERFATPPPVLELPLDRPRPALKRYGVARHRLQLDPGLVEELRAFGRRQGSTLFMTMLAGFNALLHQLTGQRDLVVGINAAPRRTAADRALVGFLVNVVLLRSRIGEGEAAAAYLARLKRLVAEGYEHQAFSPRRLLRRLKLKRDPSRFPLVAVVFDVERAGAPPELAGLAVEAEANPVGAKVDLYVNVTDDARGIEVRCDFDVDLFAPATIARWFAHYAVLLRAIAGAPERVLDDLPRLAPAPADGSGPEAPAAAAASNLTRYQRLLWTGQQLLPEAPLLALGTTWRLRVPVDPELLARAFHSVVEASDALRTVFVESDGVPSQRVQPAAARRAIELHDVSDRPEPLAAARALALERCRVPHRLSRSAVDAALFKLGDEDFLWYMNLNHLISDGWTLFLVFRLLCRAYDALLQGEAPPALALPSFGDALAQERELLGTESARQAEDHWRDVLSQPVDPVSFYGAPPARGAGAVERLTCELGPERSTRLRRLAVAKPFASTSSGLSLLGLLGALTGTWLARTSGIRSLTFGVPFLCRATAAARETVGPFMQIFPLRIAFDAGDSFASLAEKLRAESRRSLPFRDFPVGNPLHRRAYEVELNYLPVSISPFAGTPVDFEWLHPGHGGESLAVQLWDYAGRNDLRVHLDLHCEVFDARQRQLAAGHFLRVVDAFLEDPARPIRSFSLLAGEERQEVLFAFNSTRRELPGAPSFAAAFRLAVERHPGRTAVVDEAGALTYAELHERTCGIALRLAAAGVGPGSLVAILAHRDRAFLAAVLAVFEAGGAYLPLDPGHPAGRLRQILRQSGAAAALVAPELQPELRRALGGLAAGERPRTIDLDLEETRGGAGPEPLLPGDAHALAYVIYTSGSTGSPKGAMVEQAGMMNHLCAKVAALGLAGGDVAAQTASQCFDISVWQLLAPLLAGGCVRIYADDVVRDPARLLDRVEADGITVLETVPSLLRVLLDEVENAGARRPSLRSLRWLLVTGEALPADFCRRWLAAYPRVPLVNAYGPTECSDDVTHHFVRQAPEGVVPIGAPIANLRAYVVDRDSFPVPAGVAGELWIGGAGVGRGYLDDPSRTAAAFIPDGFSGEAGGRLYRTGDLGRLRPDGCLEFLGRLDDQVKIRGHRIEPGEIEAALRQHPGVREAVVAPRRDAAGLLSLTAYLVVRPGVELLPGELRGHLRERLPEPMVPAAFMLLEALPVTANGKVDRAALPAPESGRGDLEQEIVAPRNSREAAIAAIWREVLGLAEVGIHDNFFALGGDSILSIQIASLARRAGLRINPLSLFEHPTIARLAAAAEVPASRRGDAGMMVGPVPLTPIQRRFFTLDVPEPWHWNQALLLEVRRPFEPRRLTAALACVVAHHDALRHTFHRGEAGWEQTGEPMTAAAAAATLSFVDLSALPAPVRSGAIERAAAALQGSLRLAAGPLLRVAWFELGAALPGRLLLVAHHLVVDGVSWRVLLEDLDSAYRQLERGGAVELPPKTTSFKRWAERLHEHARSPELAAEEAYWLDETRSRVRPLPVDLPLGENTRDSARSLSAALDAEETQALLREVPAAFHTQINDVLLAALAEVLSGWTGGGPLLLDLEAHGREEIDADLDLSRTVGWFTSLFPVLLDVEPALPAELRLARVGERLRAVPRHGIGYGLLRYGSDPATAGRLAALPAAEVSFNYLGRLDQALSAESSFRLARELTGPTAGRGGRRSHPLEINALVVGGRLRMEWTYSANLHLGATVESLASQHAEALRRLIARSRAAPGSDAPDSAAPDAAEFQWSPRQLDGIAAVLGRPREKLQRTVER